MELIANSPILTYTTCRLERRIYKEFQRWQQNKNTVNCATKQK